MSIIKLAAVLAMIPIAAHAGQISTVQSFSGSDVVLADVFIDNFLPTFDKSFGTLTGVMISVDAVLNWDEFISVDQPDDATSKYALEQNIGLIGTEILTEINAAAQFWTVTAPAFGFGNTVTISGSVADDPALFLDPGNPEDLIIAPFGAVNQGSCTGFCGEVASDDPEGGVTGTLTTTFTFVPAAVREPWSVVLLGVALEAF